MLTKEEEAAAIAEAIKAKEARDAAVKRGTSTEHTKEIMQLSPEMREAIEKGSAEAVSKKFSEEAEMRQKILGESATQARSFVGQAVDMAQLKKERLVQENKIIAGFLAGVKQRDRGMIDNAFAEEEKYLNRKADKSLKERAMGGSTAGDELVPEIWTNQLIENIERLGLARKLARVIPMVSDTMKFPKISTNLIAYEVAAGSQITASDLVTATVTLSQRKLATITAMHNELLSNANPAVVPLLTELAAVAIALKEDTLAFTGASSTVTGVLESSTNNVVMGGSTSSGSTTIADITFDDLSRLIDALSSQYIDDGCAFVFNKKVLFHLHALTASAGYLWAPATAGSPSTIRGFNYYTSSVLPSAPAVTTAFAFFGNLKHLYFGDRGVYTVAIGTEGTVGSDNLFEKAMSAVRVTELVDMSIADASGLSILKTATT